MTFYDVGYFLAALLTFPLWLRYLLNPRYRSLIGRRLLPEKSRCTRPSIWLHAVSVGEVNSLLSLIKDLSVRHPDLSILLTASTPSGYQRALESAAPCLVLPAPVDFSFSIRRFITSHRPRLIILNELEIWPNWLGIARRSKIPILLINARLSDRAFKRYARFRWLSARMLRSLAHILCQSEKHRERFISLGVEPGRVLTIGHIKADEAQRQAAAFPKRHILERDLRLDPSPLPRLLFASSHAEDEGVFTPILEELQITHQIIVVPRHIERIPAISAAWQAAGIHHQMWSSPGESRSHNPVILFDCMGKLPALMAVSDRVVMGGTFSAQTGGHNLFEPLACSKLVLGGPHTENFTDIARDMQDRGLYLVFHRCQELLDLLAAVTEADLVATAEKSRRLLETYSGSQAAIHREINRCLSS
jgi:3-deoxy-D-manno-octulosonic-acid transferase